MLSAFITEHNAHVEDRKKFIVGSVTVTDPNDSLYRYSNFETTLDCIKSKLVDRLGGYLVVRHENKKLYLDWLNIEDIGVESTQTISFGLNLLDYTENLSADDIATAVIPLGAEIESEDSTNDVLKQYVDITVYKMLTRSEDYQKESDERDKAERNYEQLDLTMEQRKVCDVFLDYRDRQSLEYSDYSYLTNSSSTLVSRLDICLKKQIPQSKRFSP